LSGNSERQPRPYSKPKATDGRARGERALHGDDLQRDEGEDLDGDPVELVEARPRAARREPAKHAPRREVVEPVGAVKDDALRAERLGLVLGRRRLARAGGALDARRPGSAAAPT